MKRGQSAIEFIIVLGIALSFLIIIMASVKLSQQEKIEEKENQEINRIANNVKKEIQIASQTLDGYKREFRVPKTIMGNNYTIEIIENNLQIIAKENSLSLGIKEVNGEIKKGTNTIETKNGKIYLNE